MSELDNIKKRIEDDQQLRMRFPLKGGIVKFATIADDDLTYLLSIIDKQRELLVLSVEIIHGLADQQAMSDDWFEMPLDKINSHLAGE